MAVLRHGMGIETCNSPTSALWQNVLIEAAVVRWGLDKKEGSQLRESCLQRMHRRVNACSEKRILALA